jgi:multisubunit Na+/H+ antiporter MnhE subunit
MSGESILRRIARRTLFFSATWVALAGVWLLYVDNRSLPELLTGAVAAAIAATGSELVRAQRVAPIRLRARWVVRLWRPVARAPVDVLVVTRAILRQCAKRRPQRGQLRALRFQDGRDDPVANARRAIAEAFGSFAPNTIIVGVDRERELILAHQLDPDAGRPLQAIDPMRLR